jgi:filamentous hemagglutinin family protein
MNRIYRLCWNRASQQWVPASELAHSAAPAPLSRKRIVGHRAVMLSVLAASLLAAGAAYAGGGPIGGQITSGSGQIQQIGNTTVIHQNSQTLTLNWQSFDIGANQTVDFLQPGSSSIAVNRIFSSTPSEIYGHLNANGQVWLINPNGILFGQGAQVNVGGLVASTLDVDDDSLSSNTRTFSGSGTGSIVNKGTITAANGGYVALLGNNVSNQGVVSAQLGTVALGGGSAVTLTFNGDQLLHVQVDQSTLNNLVENRELIMANGGQVIMTAGAKNAILASAVNNTGVVQAQTIANHNGTITLLGGMDAGTVNVGGTLDASAPNGGNGGSIETSAAHFATLGDARITAAAPHGRAGQWVVDPVDLDINQAVATDIETALNSGTPVTETTGASQNTGVGSGDTGASGGPNGDINVNYAITWSTNASLTLNSYNGINVNDPITSTGGGSLTLLANGSSTGAGINVGAAVSTAGAVAMRSVLGNLTIGTGGSIAGATGVTLATGANFVNNVGSTAVASSGGSWLIYSTNPANDTDGGLTPNFIQYNAPYQTAALASGNGFLYSVAPTLRVTGLTGSISKSYDGTTTATLNASNLTDSGLINGDVVASATGTYQSANAGSNIAVSAPSSISGYTITSAAGIPIYGYGLSGAPSANIGTINPAVLTATIIGDPTKVYDGTTTATLSSSNYQLNGFATGQGATVNQPSSVGYVDADAGSQPINATFTISNFVANAGTNFSNYVLPTTANGLGTITQAPVLLTGLLASNKIYDGTATDALNQSNVGIYGVISGDTGNVTLDTTGGTGTFTSVNVGNNITVNVGGFTLTGSKASDYQLIAPTNLTADITPKSLTVSGVTATDKVYDGTTTDTLNVGGATLVGVVGTDNVSLLTASATGNFSQSDVGSSLAVTANGLNLSGSAAGNYTLTQPTGLTADITPRPLTVSFNGSPAKTYDGTDAATLPQADFTITGLVNGQSVAVSQSPAIYASSNAGTNIGVTASLEPSDFTVGTGTSLSNYSFNSSVTGTGIINPAPLVASIVDNPTKVYDGNTQATLGAGNYALSGFIGSDSISLVNTPTTGTYASPSAGAEGVTATLTSGNYSAVGTTLLSNYVLPTLASGFGTITQAAVDISAILLQPVTKVYDGTNTYLLNATNGGSTYTQDFSLTGFKNGDNAYVNANITGDFASKNVGNNQPFVVTLNASDFTFTVGNATDYSFPTFVYTTGSITPAPLTVGLVGNLNKVYDGGSIAQLTSSNFQISGFVAGEGATITPTTPFNYATANAGTNIAINGTLTPNNYTADSGTLLSNYTLVNSVSGIGNITQAPLFITGVYASNKVYDTTTTDTLIVGSAGLAGLVASDVNNVTLTTSTSGTFAQSNVGSGIAVTANGFSISGSASSNYNLQPITGLTAAITPATLTISGVTAASKIYDGTTSDTLNTGTALLQGVLGSDIVTLNTGAAAGTFSTSNVGNNLAVSSSGFTLGGTSAGNYIVTQPGGLTADITPKPLTAVISGSPTKVYDGTNSATLTASDYTLNGFVGTQGASIPQSATANYATPNAGTGLGVQSTLVVSDFVANAGTLLSNYILPTGASGNNGVITPYVLDLSGTRVYDAGTDAAGGLFGTLTGLNGDTFTVSGQGSSSNKNVGTYTGTGASTGSQPFNLDTLALVANGSTGSGTDLTGNYTLIGGADKLTITPAMLTVTGTTVDTKTYDGTTTATLGGTQQLQGVLGSDNVTISTDIGNFASPNAGTNIAVSSAITLGGGDSGNYILTQPTGLTGTINPLVIDLAGTRQYDGGVDAAASAFGNNGVISTGVGSQTLKVTGTGTVTNQDVGSYTQTGGTFIPGTLAFTNGSGLASNYTLGSDNTFTITPYVINLTGTRVYDTTTTADASLFGGGVVTGVNGETLTLTGSGTVSSKNVGSYTGTGSTSGSQPFNLNTLLLGNDSGQASNYTLIGGTDNLTITPAMLTVTGTTVDTKTYDGTTTATLGGTQQLQGVLGSDNVTIADDVGNFASPNVGTNIPVASAITLGGGDSGNYILTQPSGLTGTINPLVIDLAGTRQYDGGVDAAASAFGNNGVISTGVGSQTLKVTGTGTITNQDVGSYTQTGGTFIPGTLALTNGSGLASNYTLGSDNTFTITPYVINLTGTRVYDTTTTADASLFGGGVVTGVNGETLTLSGAGTVSSANASTNPYTGIGATTGSQGFNLNTLQLGNGTGLAGNYTLIGGTDSLVITPYILSLTGTRAYDGTTGANASLFGGGVLTGLNGETLTLSGAGTVSSANASTNPYTGIGAATGSQGFNLSTLQLGNGTGLAGNYTLIGGTDSLVITPYILSLTGTRVYDTTTDANASLFGNNGVLTGVNGETLTLTGTGTVTSANVGSYTGANFNPGTLGLSNGSGQASNYTLSGGSDTLAITPYVINLTGTRVYDTTTTADASLFGGGVVTGVNGETLTLSGAGTVSSANASTNPYTGIGATTGSQGFNLNTLQLGNGTGLAGNYTLIGGTDSLVITPYILSLTGTRAYDGTTGANASLFGGGVLTGLNGETLTLSGAGTVSSANASTTPYTGIGAATGSQGFNLSTLQLGNGTGLAGNYTLIGGIDSLTINRAVIDLSGTRQYDDGVDAAANVFGNNGVISTGVNGETLTLTGAGTVTGANVGTYTGTNFTPGTLALTNNTGSASNYTLVGGTDSLAITPYVLNLTGARAYDGTTDGNANLFGNNGVLTGANGQTLTLSGMGTASSANASATPYTGIGSTTGSQAFNLNTLTLTGNGSTQASNYTLIGGTDSLTINQAVISLNGTREYDGGADAGANVFSNNGVINTGVNGETLTLTGAGTVTGANVGSYTGANFNTGTLALTNGSGTAGNYTLAGGSDSLAITPYILNLTGARAYDGTTGADASLFGTNGVLAGVNGQTLTLSGAGTASSANASATPYTGIGSTTGSQAFNLNTLTLTGNGSTQASNYSLIGGTDSLTINQAVINLSGTRVYDGGVEADASAFGNNGVINTGVNGETLTLTGAGGVTSANVGSYTGANFNAGTLALTSGSGSASNYTLAGGSDNLAITPYVLNLTGTRVYDGTTGANANLFGNNGVLTGVNGETLTLSGTGVLSSKNVGQQLPFANNGLNGYTLTGNGSALGGNYTLTGGTDWVSITPLAITVDANGQNKTYNGNTTAGVTLTSNGVLPGDTVSFSDGSANFSSPNAGNGISIGVSNITGNGADAGNYIFNTTATTSADITPAIINLSGTRTYDGLTDANASLFGSNGVITGVNGQTLSLNGSGSVAAKNVGTYTAGSFNVSGLTLGDGTGIASNYTLIGGTDTLSITPLAITINATGTNRLYNGGDGDAVTLTSTGVLSGDQVGFTDTSANFNNPYVGNGKPVTVSGISLTGADAGNYIVTDPVTTTDANITGTGYMGTGIDASWIAQMQSTLYPASLATPYGSAASDTVGVYIGNHKLQHKPIERNRIRSDFHSGFPLQVDGDGVRLPLDASP